jgi:hypothetical protein
MSSLFLLQKWRTGGQNGSILGVWYQWEGKDVERGCRRMNMCINRKMRPVETSRNGGRRDKGE